MSRPELVHATLGGEQVEVSCVCLDHDNRPKKGEPCACVDSEEGVQLDVEGLTCSKCDGSGIVGACPHCNGSGVGRTVALCVALDRGRSTVASARKATEDVRAITCAACVDAIRTQLANRLGVVKRGAPLRFEAYEEKIGRQLVAGGR
jgi:hypothetical protein